MFDTEHKGFTLVGSMSQVISGYVGGTGAGTATATLPAETKTKTEPRESNSLWLFTHGSTARGSHDGAAHPDLDTHDLFAESSTDTEDPLAGSSTDTDDWINRLFEPENETPVLDHLIPRHRAPMADRLTPVEPARGPSAPTLADTAPMPRVGRHTSLWEILTDAPAWLHRPAWLKAGNPLKADWLTAALAWRPPTRLVGPFTYLIAAMIVLIGGSSMLLIQLEGHPPAVAASYPARDADHSTALAIRPPAAPRPQEQPTSGGPGLITGGRPAQPEHPVWAPVPNRTAAGPTAAPVAAPVHHPKPDAVHRAPHAAAKPGTSHSAAPHSGTGHSDSNHNGTTSRDSGRSHRSDRSDDRDFSDSDSNDSDQSGDSDDSDDSGLVGQLTQGLLGGL